ncbi:helicase-associated domain-containing protein [Streptomyces sp. 7-21]|uniref:helicase-associated domain-containing protein n=1 Tax=Streptomyces sp. 7-21 TaxID=2802283 RepID=UPI00191EB4DE|nr:helicase-associated domain-containing protein [Streptomyces sp. 7-21]MBL1067552.1 helicase-associated domain-containing protein [Streptomyces sp. 7-21]
MTGETSANGERGGQNGRTGGTTGTKTPRTLADELRTRSDEQLADLLRARADLLSPLPSDLSQLATRAAARTSVLRALERLDVFSLQTAEALAIAPQPCPLPVLASLLPGEDCARGLPRALGVLRGHALLWGPPEALRLVRTAQELLTPTPERPSPTGLGPTLAEAAGRLSPSRAQQLLAAAGLPATADAVSAIATLTELFTDPDRMDALLDGAPDRARAALDRLVWGPPYGTVPADPGPHLRWLLDRGLLVPHTPGTVVLPREVALHLRGGRAHREPRPLPPELTPRATHSPASADAAAAGAALAALQAVETLAAAWETDGPPVLRSGGLSARELKRAAVTLDLPEPEAAFWIELAYVAGLIAADGEADERYAPTPAYDEWLALPPQRRWAQLVTAWLAATRVPGLVGGRDAKGKPLAALGPGLDRGPAAELRRRVLGLLASLPPGTEPEHAAVEERLAWELPRRLPAEARSRLTADALAEAERLGVTGRGALASFVRPLLGGARPDSAPDAGDGLPPDDVGTAVDRAAGLLAEVLPEPLDHVLLQADLTAVAPGPLRRDLARVMAVAADVESTGGATVYRFTSGSVRRALDAGWTAAELHRFLAEHSRTPVPQPLAYLVDDVARRHGQLRVGAAGSYLRCEDEAQLTELLADRRAAPLKLRRIAPTVLVSPLAPGTLLERLRGLGFAPAAEAEDGAVVSVRAQPRRTPPRTPPVPAPDSYGAERLDPPLLAAAVRALRAGDRAAPGGGARQAAARVPPPEGPVPRTPPDETVAVLRAAAREGALVRVGHVDADGTARHHVLAPVTVEGGFVTGFDHTAQEVRTYPLHRLTGAARHGEPPA